MLGAKEAQAYAGWHSHHRQADRLDEHGRASHAVDDPRGPLIFILGGNEFRLRQGSAFAAKRLNGANAPNAWRKGGAIYAGRHSLIIDKPAGWTSMDVCAKLRGILRKAHRPRGNARPHGDRRPARVCGPRDQSGAVCRKRAKGISRRFEARHGHRHAGHDRHGAGSASGHRRRGRGARGAGALYRRAFAAPPMYSALKVNGQKLYDLARQGKTVGASRAPSPFTSWSCWSSPHRTNCPCAWCAQGDLHPHALPRSPGRRSAAVAAWRRCGARWRRVSASRRP